MSIEVIFKDTGSQTSFEKKLWIFNFKYDKVNNHYIIDFLNKWIWLYYYDNKNQPYVVAEFSSDFRNKEIDKNQFINEMLNLGFRIDE